MPASVKNNSIDFRSKTAFNFMLLLLTACVLVIIFTNNYGILFLMSVFGLVLSLSCCNTYKVISSALRLDIICLGLYALLIVPRFYFLEFGSVPVLGQPSDASIIFAFKLWSISTFYFSTTSKLLIDFDPNLYHVDYKSTIDKSPAKYLFYALVIVLLCCFSGLILTGELFTLKSTFFADKIASASSSSFFFKILISFSTLLIIIFASYLLVSSDISIISLSLMALGVLSYFVTFVMGRRLNLFEATIVTYSLLRSQFTGRNSNLKEFEMNRKALYTFLFVATIVIGSLAAGYVILLNRLELQGNQMANTFTYSVAFSYPLLDTLASIYEQTQSPNLNITLMPFVLLLPNTLRNFFGFPDFDYLLYRSDRINFLEIFPNAPESKLTGLPGTIFSDLIRNFDILFIIIIVALSPFLVRSIANKILVNSFKLSALFSILFGMPLFSMLIFKVLKDGSLLYNIAIYAKDIILVCGFYVFWRSFLSITKSNNMS